MGNKICVDKKPSKIENIISFNSNQIDQSIINSLNNNVEKEGSQSNSYQHLSMWCLSETNDNGINNANNNNINNTKQENNNEKNINVEKVGKDSNNLNNTNNIKTPTEINNSNNLNNLCEEEPKITISPVEIANIHKNHFLLDSKNVYVLLLIFKKDSENEIENSPFPTGLWGIIESLSNMTPRGLLFAFPATHSNSQNLESFLLSKRELNDSEFKYMLFIWNGKKSTGFLRSVSLMKAFDLDKSLMCTHLVQFIYEGYYFNFNEKNNEIIPEYVGCVQLGDIINNTVENSEDNSTPSSDKINNLHETVYLFKLLYPNTKYKKKSKSKKNKKINNLNLGWNNNNNTNGISNSNNNENSEKKDQNILYKGFNDYFLESGNKKSFYENFTEIDIGSNINNLNNNNMNNLNNIALNDLSNNFGNNNNLEKSNLSNSTMKNNKNIVMPPKLNLNLNINENKLFAINSLEDTSNSKSSLRMGSSKEDNKNDILNGLNSNNSNSNNSGSNSNNNNKNNEQNQVKQGINNNTKKEKDKNDNNKLSNNEEYIEEDYEDEDDLDLISSTNNDLIINKKYLIGSSTNYDNSLKKIKVPKLMVSLQKNQLSEEKMTERAKIKSEQEESLNILPESTLISTSQHILNNNNNINNNNNLLSKTKINIGSIGLSNILNNNNNLNNNNLNDKNKNNNNQDKVPNNMNLDNIDIKALNEDFSLKDSERKKIISDYYSKHLSEIIPNFLYVSSYNATKNRELLEKNKITHIINCAADFCENVFEQENKFTYLSFYLKDHVLENIECIFYECIKFIENVREKGGRVLIHCIQGISRSVSIVMAYIIFTKKISYDKAFNLVQSKREISSPNFGFSIQLQNFYSRLYDDPSRYRYIPKIFAVGSFQNEQAGKIVCRLMNEPFYEHKENGLPRMLDKRGIFIIVSLTNVYLWIGSKISLTLKDIYLKTALDYINILRQYEKAPQTPGGGGPVIIYDGKETDEFLNDLLKTKEKILRFKRNISGIFPEWNSWYKEIKNMSSNDIKYNTKDKNNNGNNLSDNNDKKEFVSSSSSITEIKKGFFLYPNDKPDAVLDFDDLNDETFLIACIYEKKSPKIYLWKGKLVDINENILNDYKNKVSKIFFKQYGLTDEQCNDIESVIETPLEESDEFLNFI